MEELPLNNREKLILKFSQNNFEVPIIDCVNEEEKVLKEFKKGAS